MIVNADITIFNRRYVKEDRTEKYVATRIRGVSFYGKRSSSSSGTEMTTDDTYTIRIPVSADMEGKEYVEEISYKGMTDEEAALFWTLQKGAFIVRGISDTDTMTERELCETYPDVVIITDYTDNRDRCSDAMKHWRVGGK